MPRHADALYNLGVACAEDGQTERALFCYELTTHFNPNCAEAWNNLGVLHKEADNLERAAECYMAALNIRPNFPQVRMHDHTAPSCARTPCGRYKHAHHSSSWPMCVVCMLFLKETTRPCHSASSSGLVSIRGLPLRWSPVLLLSAEPEQLGCGADQPRQSRGGAVAASGSHFSIPSLCRWVCLCSVCLTVGPVMI